MKKRISFYTVDLCKGREYLMPWRTILEVAKRINDKDNDAIIINACYNENERTDFEWNGVKIKAISPGYLELSHFIKKASVDVLFMEVKWRDGLKNWKDIQSLKCKKIAYFSGGVYSLSNSLKLLSISNFSLSKPYLIESVVPKCLLKNKLKKSNFSSAIGLTEYTSQIAIQNGIKNVETIYPGKDEFEYISTDNSILSKYDLNDKKFLLFTGAPIAFRGSSELIKAIDRLNISDIHLVMLMRLDKGTQSDEFLKALNSMKNRNRITIIDEKLSREQLKAFFSKAYCAILPFIVIPSEVPLTYFEIMSCGTPIISFNNGGTTEYLKKGLILSRLNIKDLIKSIENLWYNEKIRIEKSKMALDLMEKHPDWNFIANEWKKLL